VPTIISIPGSPTHGAAHQRARAVIAAVRQLLTQPGFLVRHRDRPQSFTRQPTLTFPVILLLILQKTVKSLQAHLDEFLESMAPGRDWNSLTAGAFTRARAKVDHRAYVELNQGALLAQVYHGAHADQVYRWRGWRLLAIDSSLVRLPMTRALGWAFGLVETANDKGQTGVRYPQARISVLYDVGNRFGLEALMVRHKQSEVALAYQHLARVEPSDLVLTDRGFSGYTYFTAVRQRGAHFLGRCSQGSFAIVQQLFDRNEAGVSVTVTLKAPSDQRARLRRKGWPLELAVRFITVRLDTGELEVLATSLLDETAYPTEAFAELYHLRWGIETYYGQLKGRLDLENWSGETEEAVRQDFQAMVFLSNLESVVAPVAQRQLTAKTQHCQHPAQINRAVSLHSLKTQIIALLIGSQSLDETLNKLVRLFMGNPVKVRKNRRSARRPISMHRSYHFQRKVKKTVF